MVVIKFILTSRLMFLAFAWLGAFFVPLITGYLGNQVAPNSPYLIWIFANMDGRHLIDIATKGYENFNFAYFPLYPAIVSLIGNAVRVPHVYIGIAVSVLSLLGAAYYLYKIVKLDFEERTARTTILFLAIFPFSFFYQAVYTDSLFLFLSTASFYYARNKQWLLSGVFGYLTCLTRIAGVALPIALLVEWLIENKVTIKNLQAKVSPFFKTIFLTLLLTSLGFISYLVYLQVFHGNFLLFQKSFSAWQQSSIVFPPQVFFRYLKILVSVDKTQFVYWIAVLELVCTLLYSGLAYYTARKIRLSYGVLMFLIILIPSFTGTFAGMPRYALHMFPIFITIAFLLNKYPRYKKVVVALSLVLGFVFTTLFTRGYFLT